MTTSTLIRTIVVTTAFAEALTGGTLFAFSTFVLPALRRLPPDTAVASMQAINTQAPRSLLMLPLIGSAVGCLAVLAALLLRQDSGGRTLVLVGAILGLASFAVTAIYHVPHNDALGRLDPHAGATAAAWVSYARGWAAWNHVRTLLALGSAVALVAALRRAD
jgi:uncharacterized membrane protein